MHEFTPGAVVSGVSVKPFLIWLVCLGEGKLCTNRVKSIVGNENGRNNGRMIERLNELSYN